MNLPTHVTMVEVGARDGLQNEKALVPTATKIELITRLQTVGLREIEVTSFVSPKWVPQMADAADVMAGMPRRDDMCFSVLTPNMKGFEGALAAGANEVVVFAAATESFSQRNINCSIAESIDRFAPVVAAAHAAGMKVRAAVSCAMGCPYEGAVSPAAVERVVQGLKAIGVDHMGIPDTIGVATPIVAQRALEQALKHYSIDEVSGHFHDTYGMALANVMAALQMGVHIFDASVGGLGGCPYAKGATGNVATEDVVYLLHGLGIHTGIDLTALVSTGAWISDQLGKPYNSRVGKALWTKQQAG